jgi:hypothetical protein
VLINIVVFCHDNFMFIKIRNKYIRGKFNEANNSYY